MIFVVKGSSRLRSESESLKKTNWKKRLSSDKENGAYTACRYLLKSYHYVNV